MSVKTLSMSQRDWIATRSAALLHDLARDACILGLELSHLANGATVIDCGVHVLGSLEAGRRITEISQGGMAAAHIGTANIAGTVLPELTVDSWLPKLSAYGLQVSTALTEIDPAIRISGPILARFAESRLNMRREELASAAWGIAVVESDQLPNLAIADALACLSDLPAGKLTLIVVPTRSVAGVTQIAGRLNESVVFTMEESLGIDCSCVSQLLGTVPIALSSKLGTPYRVTPDDFIHYMGRVSLTIDHAVGMDLAQLAAQLAFDSTPIYGKLFTELLESSGGVFEAIPGLVDLNKVAQVTVIDQTSGSTFSAGERCESILFGPHRKPELNPKESL
jgi:methenyltetrahydromethanopterin cyclohydrolase